jgi:anti-anti-sigma factor
MATPRLCQRRNQGTTDALRSTTSSTLGPVDGMKISSVLRMAVSAAAGRIWIGPSHWTARPRTDAVVTRKRGTACFPVRRFHSSPAWRNTSIGPIAVIRESGEVTILDLQGTCTLDGGSEQLSGQLRRFFDNGACNLLLNLEGLTQVDSSGISVFVESYLSVRRNRCNLKLLRPRNRVRMVLNLFRLLDIIPSFEDETQALPAPTGQIRTAMASKHRKYTECLDSDMDGRGILAAIGTVPPSYLGPSNLCESPILAAD